MYYILLLTTLLAACQYLPQLADDIEAVATDTAIKIEISRETFQKETDLNVSVKVQNKDQPTQSINK